ncbi:type VI secretion system membrane subunit TssM, partial [Paraburkholderia sp. BR14261]
MKWIQGFKRPAVVTFAGVLALCALVWLEGPLVAFNGTAPFESSARRWSVIALILACWALYWGVRFAKTRIASSTFVQRLVADALDPAKHAPDPARKAADADVAALRTRFEAALKTLRESRAPAGGARGIPR